MKRAWRFLALLSVTPIMTVVCVVMLFALTRMVLRDTRNIDPRWSIHNIPYAHQISGMKWRPIGTAQVNRNIQDDRWVIDEGSSFRVSDTQKDAWVAILIGPTNVKYRGFYAVTSEVVSMGVTFKHIEDYDVRADVRRRLVSYSKNDQVLSLFVPAMRDPGQGKYEIPIYRGYAVNAAALVCLALGIRSLVWLYRGVPLRQLSQVWRPNGECKRCGYSLAGLNAAQCPECGAETTGADRGPLAC